MQSVKEQKSMSADRKDRKEWQRPSLQKLPIAMTAHNKGTLNEGAGVGKGDSGTANLS
jgi:hypothetical protein